MVHAGICAGGGPNLNGLRASRVKGRSYRDRSDVGAIGEVIANASAGCEGADLRLASRKPPRRGCLRCLDRANRRDERCEQGFRGGRGLV